MSAEDPSAEPTLEELYEDAPCGYLSLRPDGLILRANRTFLRSTGFASADVVGRRRLQDLLAPGSRLFHATHWQPLLELEGEVREIPADLVRADGGRMTVLLNAILTRGPSGEPVAIRASLFDATDRRRYERELVAARDVERAARERVECLQRMAFALSGATGPHAVADAVLGELVGFVGADHGELVVGVGRPGELVFEHRADAVPDGAVAAERLVLALEVGGAELGALRLSFATPDALDAEERLLLDACAAQCAQALHRVQVFAELEERSGQQAAVARLGARALADVALPVLLDEAASIVREVLCADLTAIVATGDAPRTARLAAGSGWPSGPLPGGEHRLAELHVAPLERDALRDEHGIRDTLAVAIGARASSFGVLAVHSRTPRHFTPTDASFAQGVANVLFSAIERRRSDDASQHQARHDPLTGLPNRLLLGERLAMEIARARRHGQGFALCLLDLDFFKLINDSLGHPTGDSLLCQVASRLSATVRGEDTVARLGGDEFVVLCASLEAECDAESLAARIAGALRRPFVLGGSEHVVRASVGVVVGDGSSTAEGLLRDADVAMYSAKERGRGQHAHFDQSMRDLADQRVRVEAELRAALRHDELRVFYQPVIRSADERVVGLEALVRWQHPERGLVPPGAFIPVAEECGLIVDLGRFVLEHACEQLVAWRDAGLASEELTVAVNVSARQLAQPGFAAEVARTLERTGLAATPELLGLEITETVVMGSGDHAAAVLAELSALGIELLLDDFGTGVSSLARLKRFPVDTLKIDRAFVSGLGTADDDGEDDAIVAAVVAMADALGLRVVAEGVETPHQLQRLRELGCERLQGFLFSRPLPADEVLALLAPLARSG